MRRARCLAALLAVLFVVPTRSVGAAVPAIDIGDVAAGAAGARVPPNLLVNLALDESAAAAAYPGAADYARFINEAAFPAYGPADWAAFARRIFTEKHGVPALDYDPAIAVAFKPPEGEPAPPPPDLWPLFQGLAFAPDKAERPLLLIRGGLSDLLAPATADKMREIAPHMAFAEVPNVGHAPMLDEPQALSALDAWLMDAP